MSIDLLFEKSLREKCVKDKIKFIVIGAVVLKKTKLQRINQI
jgi:hypothetical protein